MIVFFTDLDGTLLDHDTYDWQPARCAIGRIRAEGHALVLTTSKARAEVAELRRAMEIGDPFVVENGGAIYVPAGYFGVPAGMARGEWEVVELGTPYPLLVDALRCAAQASGVQVRGFAEMEIEEVARRTGLPLEVARLAHQREFDEPFVVESGDPAKLCAAIEALGFRWTRGGRFFHIIRDGGKAKAVARLAELYRGRHRPLRTVGLGDGINDAGFLRAVDSAWLIPSRQTADLAPLVPGARVAEAKGPAGWALAVATELDR